MRNFPNVIWPPVEHPSPKGSTPNGDEIRTVTMRATTVGFISACISRPIHAWVYGPDGSMGSILPWLVGLGAWVTMAVLGYLHYRKRGPAP
jgi:hypothetical protein